MKHGDKAKAKSAKAVSKASGTKGSSKIVAKSRPAAGGKTEKAGAPKSARANGAKTAVERSTPRSRPEADGPSFANPVVAAAFKRVVKKYPVALKRLTD